MIEISGIDYAQLCLQRKVLLLGCQMYHSKISTPALTEDRIIHDEIHGR